MDILYRDTCRQGRHLCMSHCLFKALSTVIFNFNIVKYVSLYSHWCLRKSILTPRSKWYLDIFSTKKFKVLFLTFKHVNHLELILVWRNGWPSQLFQTSYWIMCIFPVALKNYLQIKQIFVYVCAYSWFLYLLPFIWLLISEPAEDYFNYYEFIF